MKERILKPGPWPIKEHLVSREEAATALGMSLWDLEIMVAKTNGPVYVKIGKRTCQIELPGRTLKLPVKLQEKPVAKGNTKTGEAAKVKRPKGKSRFERSLGGSGRVGP